jgi:photosystem II stability/assembly factor-like uncharacterized protein
MVTRAPSSVVGDGDLSRSSLRAWPAYLMTVIVAVAAAYAFSPRPVPVYTPTPMKPDQILVTGLAQDGDRIIAAGELGHILIADDADGPWREAKVTPDRGSTFTQVAVLGKGVALAVGQDGWIVRSTDGGETWNEVAFDTEHTDPLLSIGVAGDKVFAVGSFGQLRVSTDQGKTWQKLASDAFGDKHLYGLVQQADGSLLAVGEQGLLVHSGDDGRTWQKLPSIYEGSFFGALALPSKVSLVFGMRGHAFRSLDNGQTWQPSELPVKVSLFGGRVTPDGEVVLVGENRTVMISKDDGAHFTLAAQGDRHTLVTVLPLADNRLLTAGEGGIKLQDATVAPAANAGGAQ